MMRKSLSFLCVALGAVLCLSLGVFAVSSFPASADGTAGTDSVEVTSADIIRSARSNVNRNLCYDASYYA